MLLACTRCHRQYDVGDHPPGAKVRCLCGELNTVPSVRSRQVGMLHCSNCGGRLAREAKRCEYCAAEPVLADRGIGPACPECFAATATGARHCGACGVRLAPESVLRALRSLDCPRCKHALSECESERARWIECTGCAGLWLDEALFERIAREQDAGDGRGGLATLFTRGEAPVGAVTLERPVRYLACPVCSQIMHRRNFASCSGVVLDWCRAHGWWFDAQELERVLAFLAAGGLEKARRQQHEQRVRELDNARTRGDPELPGPAWEPRRSLFDGLLERLVEFLRQP